VTTRDDLIGVAQAHAAAEAVNDLDTVYATLEHDPLYELQPVGLVFRGMDAVRRYYEHFFSTFQPLVAGFALRSESVAEDGVVQEYTIWTTTGPDAAVERHEVVGILTFGAEKLSGERVYASERLLRIMFGPVYDECTPIEVGNPA
jgi:ketosteroid isomerase-like protein